MSSETTPIPHDRFAAALEHLSVGSLHLKAAEIRNSLAHLRSSNAQLAEFADAGDTDCTEAIKENQDVMQRFEDRIEMLKAEVEKRGLPWVEDDPTKGDVAEPGEQPVVNGTTTATTSGTLNDEELARRLQERMAQDLGGDDDHDNEDGVHL